jgi:hypothetical protein
LLVGKITGKFPVDEKTLALVDNNITDGDITVKDISIFASVLMSW